MHNHFDKHLNIKNVILEHKPKRIVECGAGTGENTRQIQALLDVYSFEYTVISDAAIAGLRSSVNLVSGLSYIELEKFQDSSIDFCIIDTDHNYWTLAKELDVLDRKLSEGGLVALHDTWAFYHDTGMAMAYSGGEPYPEEAILNMGLNRGGLTDALIDFLSYRRFDYRLLAYTTESQGAALIQKKKIDQVYVCKPTSDAPYSGSGQYERSLSA